MGRTYWVYIMCNRRNGALYTGVTGHLQLRVHQHREGLVKGFTQRYGIRRLVHVEPFGDVGLAIQRERQVNRWNRAWKIALIEQNNPDWDDLYLSMH